MSEPVHIAYEQKQKHIMCTIEIEGIGAHCKLLYSRGLASALELLRRPTIDAICITQSFGFIWYIRSVIYNTIDQSFLRF